MRIVIVDSDELLIREICQVLEAVKRDSDSIVIYKTFKSLEDDLNDSLVMADIFYIGLAGNKRRAIDLGLLIKKVIPHSQIVFAYSDDKFVEECYEVEHVYGLKRPFAEKSVANSYNRAEELLMKEVDSVFNFKFRGKTIFVNHSDIMYFEKNRRIVKLFLKDSTTREFYETMDTLTSRLPKNFVRCHNSYVINKDYVVEKKKSGLSMRNGAEITISRKYSELLDDL